VVAALINVTRLRKRLSFPLLLVADASLALVLWTILPQPSIAPWWGPLTSIVSRWPLLWKKSPKALAHGGPLGMGCGKLVEVLVAIFLWRLVQDEWPTISMGPLPGIPAWLGMFVLSAGVNLVLQLWSSTLKSRGDHSGVNDMVESTQGRALSRNEHIQIFGLALLNGACEEITSRWFWMAEFQRYTTSTQYANLVQAAVFGIWHYHGIPSGFAGVALTFVYGYIMGLLCLYGKGLFLPIVAHAIADYYIFAIIARQQQQQTTKDNS
jgi:membrane protease YdiL (CAAX protease family)